MTDPEPAVKSSNLRVVKDPMPAISITDTEPGGKSASQELATKNANPVQTTTRKDTSSPAYTRPRYLFLRTNRGSVNNGSCRRVIHNISDLFEEYSLQNMYSLKESLSIFVGKTGNFFHCKPAVIVQLFFFLQIKTRLKVTSILLCENYFLGQNIMDTWRDFQVTVCTFIVTASSSSVLLLSTIKQQAEQAVKKLQSLEYIKHVIISADRPIH